MSKQQTVLNYLDTAFQADGSIYDGTGANKALIHKIFTDRKDQRLKQNTMIMFFEEDSGELVGETSGFLWIKQEITVEMEFKRLTHANDEIYDVVEAIIALIKADRGLGGNVRDARPYPEGYRTNEDKAVETAIMIIEIEWDA
jgi:hypothetical protein